MTFVIDAKDWLGGYPYVAASSSAVISLFEQLGDWTVVQQDVPGPTSPSAVNIYVIDRE